MKGWVITVTYLEGYLLELSISAVKPVLNSQPAVAGVELQVVEVMELWGEEQREVVAEVVVDNLHADHTEPEPRQGDGTSHQKDSVRDGYLSIGLMTAEISNVCGSIHLIHLNIVWDFYIFHVQHPSLYWVEL